MTGDQLRQLCLAAIDADPQQAYAVIKTAATPIWGDETAIERLQEIVREKGTGQ